MRARGYSKQVKEWIEVARAEGSVSSDEHLSFTALFKAIGQCTYGKQGPNALFMHYDTMREVFFKMFPDDWTAMNIGGAEIIACAGIRRGTIFVCTESDPTNPKLNWLLDFQICETPPVVTRL